MSSLPGIRPVDKAVRSASQARLPSRLTSQPPMRDSTTSNSTVGSTPIWEPTWMIT